jgi:hypothetical protein
MLGATQSGEINQITNKHGAMQLQFSDEVRFGAVADLEFDYTYQYGMVSPMNHSGYH